ncbi:MAG: hypothetical protein WD225_06990 [Ilumatobacteraceae bacterium]
MTRRVLAGLVLAGVVLAGVVLAGVVGAACGGGDGDGGDGGSEHEGRPLVGEIAPAIEAVERSLGGAQEYFEINADERLVNLFVATDDGATVTPHLYLDGEIQPPAPPRSVEAGTTFTADDVALDADVVLDQVGDELPDSTLTSFVIVVGPDDRVRYEVLARSPRGGTLAVEVSGAGEVIGVEPL